jgi:hypothetical protein
VTDQDIDLTLDLIDEDLARTGAPIWEPPPDKGSSGVPSPQYARTRNADRYARTREAVTHVGW